MIELMQDDPMPEMLDKWKIQSMMKKQAANRDIQDQENLLNITTAAMIGAIQHETLMKSYGHSSRFVRSSKQSKEIAHTFYMAQAIERATGKKKPLVWNLDFNHT